MPGTRDAELRELIEAFGDAVWSRDLVSGVLDYISPTVRQMFGLADDQPTEEGAFWRVLLPEDRELFLRMRAGTSDAAEFDFRFLRHGEVRWANSRIRYTRDEHGQRIRATGAVVDITARKLAEAAALAEAQRAQTLASVAEHLSGNLELRAVLRAIRQEALRALRAREASVRRYDAASDSLIDEHVGEHDPQSEIPVALPRARLAFLAPNERVRYVVAGVREDAQTAPLATRFAGRPAVGVAIAAMFRNETLLGSIGVIIFEGDPPPSPEDLALLRSIADLGALAITNAQLLAETRRIGQRYREIVETAREAIYTVDVGGTIQLVNPQFTRLLGYSSDEAVGRPAADLLFAEEAAALPRYIAERLAGDEAPRELRMRARDGRELWVTASVAVLRDGGGTTGLLVLLNDVTEARRLEEKLLHTQKLESLGVLAGGIAHDFNNLLVGILGNAGMALAELPPESAVRPLVDDIQTAALHASDLTRQLLAYSGKGRFVIGRLDLNRVVDEMAHLLSAVISKGVALRYRLMEGLPAIEGDATQIRQIVMNLITNASDAMGARGGAVAVTTTVVDASPEYLRGLVVGSDLAPGSYVCLEVSDTGSGMSAETVARIFDPFFTTKFTGRGLGLAAVLGILRAHKGAIEVRSEPGHGTTFRVLLPAIDAPADTAVTDAAARAPARSGIILVIDDEPGVRKVAARMLKRAGYEALLAADGAEGIEIYRRRCQEIRAVILDVTMPKMGGEETFIELCRIRPDVRVLLCSGYAEQEATSRFAGKGLAGFLEKPFRPEVLLERLASVLDK